MVNVKKSNGGSESEYEDLKKYALEDRLEIKRELEIIQPDIIVCGNNLSLLKLVLGEELQKCNIYGKEWIFKRRNQSLYREGISL